MNKHLIPHAYRPARESFLTFGAPAIGEAEIQEVVDTMRSGWLGTGPRCQRFEEAFRNYAGAAHAIALNSCTAGLELALEAAGVGSGDEVITTPLTFCATANAIVHRGATPVFADVDRQTGNIEPEHIIRALSTKTKAIVPVHLYGWPCRMDEILEIAKARGLYVIEDAAHATEAWYHNRKVGSIGDATVFSFYVTKNMTTGEGGMVTTNRSDWAERIRVNQLHGLSKNAWKRYSAEGFQPYDVLTAGFKFNMTDIQAAIGIHQLARLEDNLKIREQYWAMYAEALSGLSELVMLNQTDASADLSTRHARHLFTVLLASDLKKLSRWQFIEGMNAARVGTGIHFLALHLSKYYRDRFGYHAGDFPNAEFIAERTVSLPLSASMTPADVQDVIEAVKRTLRVHPR